MFSCWITSSKDLYSGNQNSQLHQLVNQNDPMSCYTSRRNSTTSNANSEPQEVAPHLVKYVSNRSSNMLRWFFTWIIPYHFQICSWFIEILVQAEHKSRRGCSIITKCCTGHIHCSWFDNIRQSIRISCESRLSTTWRSIKRTTRRRTGTSLFSGTNNTWSSIEGLLKWTSFYITIGLSLSTFNNTVSITMPFDNSRSRYAIRWIPFARSAAIDHPRCRLQCTILIHMRNGIANRPRSRTKGDNIFVFEKTIAQTDRSAL